MSTTRGGITSNYSYGTKPHAVTQVGATSYTYDANGNMLVGSARTWDAENRLTSITKDTVTTTFIYDGDGNRVKKTVNNGTTTKTSRLLELSKEKQYGSQS
jgi:YD repeat-containing protein